MHNIKELKIWNKAVDLTVEVYRAVQSFPKDVKYGLTSQVRRSVVSIPSNIAEGAGRNSNKEFVHFLGISQGSSFELQTQLIVSNRLGFLNDETLDSLLLSIAEIQKMNHSFKNTLKEKQI